MTPKKATNIDGGIFQLKISLEQIKPSIWRSIRIPRTATFFDFHVAIQGAFGWEDSHLHQFFTANPFRRRPGQYRIIKYPIPDDDLFDDEKSIDERNVLLGDYFHALGDALWYEYDFGDSWMHAIVLEKILPVEAAVRYPILVDGKRACPPEDCGGTGGYYHLFEVLADSKNEEFDDVLDWLGIENADEFDSEKFDKRTVRFQDPKKRLRDYRKGFGM